MNCSLAGRGGAGKEEGADPCGAAWEPFTDKITDSQQVISD